MKIEETDLVRCKTCKVVLTVDDVPGHEQRHGKPIAVAPAGKWIPWFLRPSLKFDPRGPKPVLG